MFCYKNLQTDTKIYICKFMYTLFSFVTILILQAFLQLSREAEYHDRHAIWRFKSWKSMRNACLRKMRELKLPSVFRLGQLLRNVILTVFLLEKYSMMII